MTTISIEIPEHIKTKFKIWKTISYDNLIIKTIGKEYLSPDLRFTKYEEMNDIHKQKYNNIEKSKLLNI